MNQISEYDKVTYHFKSEDRMPISFKGFNCPSGLVRKIMDGSIDLGKANEDQEKFRSNLSEITKQKWEHKSEE